MNYIVRYTNLPCSGILGHELCDNFNVIYRGEKQWEDNGAQLARQAGISVQTLYRWRDDFLRGDHAALSGAQNGMHDAQVTKEIAQRDQVIGELTVANRVLKKFSGNLR